MCLGPKNTQPRARFLSGSKLGNGGYRTTTLTFLRSRKLHSGAPTGRDRSHVSFSVHGRRTDADFCVALALLCPCRIMVLKGNVLCSQPASRRACAQHPDPPLCSVAARPPQTPYACATRRVAKFRPTRRDAGLIARSHLPRAHRSTRIPYADHHRAHDVPASNSLHFGRLWSGLQWLPLTFPARSRTPSARRSWSRCVARRSPQQAQRLRERLEMAACQAGLTHSYTPYASTEHTLDSSASAAPSITTTSAASPASEAVRKSSARTTPDLYEGLFGGRFGLGGSPLQSLSSGSPVSMRATPDSPLAGPHRVAPRSPMAIPSANECFNTSAASPQRWSHHGSATSEMQSYPPSMAYAPEPFTSPSLSPMKRRRTGVREPFSFPQRRTHTPSGRLPNGNVASSLAQDLGLCTDVASVRRPHTSVPRRSRHARFASTSSLPDRHLDTNYIPIRSFDPLPSDVPRMTPREESWRGHPAPYAASAGHSPDANGPFVSHTRHPSDAAARGFAETASPSAKSLPLRTHSDRVIAAQDQNAWSAPTSIRSHRRSVSHSMLETPVPVSHDRSSSITTPPSETPTFPETPKSLGSNFRYGDLESISPSPLPRQTRRPLPDRAHANTPPKPTRHLRFRSDDLGARGARPLWAQSPPRMPGAPSFVRM